MVKGLLLIAFTANAFFLAASTAPHCPANEVYSKCIQGNCSPQSCTKLGFPIACPRIDPKHCKEGCLCKPGYARNNSGYCIPLIECPSCGGDWNATSGCGGYCNKRCSDVGKTPGACAESCIVNGCDCKSGYYFDEVYRKCVKPRDCSSSSCRGDPNAQAGCGGYCNSRCSDIGKKPRPCLLICEVNGCDCKEGFYYDNTTAKCVTKEQCTKTCGVNEEYNECMNSNCGPTSCKHVGYPISCVDISPENCTKGCQCKQGYVRDDNGNCIPITNCPSCGGDRNATSGCGGYCNKRCSDVGRKPGACALSCILNGCDCKSGYYFDEVYRKCVKPGDCSNTPICSAANNEVYSNCINGGCQPKNCSQYGQPKRCVKTNPKYCIKGCLCKEGYLRDTNGNCVPADNCPEACNQPNEEYNNCAWDCPPQTCESLDKSYACPIKEGDNCKPMCRCKPGYYRNKLGMCITEEQCRRCMGPNEYYSCGGACDNVCETLSEQSQDNCPIINIKCNEMCYCDKGYARANNGTCIPIASCNTPQCPANEFYSECTQGNCSPRTCSQIGFPIACPRIDPKFCKKGCLCNKGYVRTKGGACIRSTRCPSCGGDPNAESSYCGGNCLKKCYDLQNPNRPRPCPKICLLNSCECKKGYYLNENNGRCVLPENCPLACGKDEVYSSCVNGGCDKRSCSQLNSPRICIDPLKCYEGCVCKKGYLRTDNGTCVPNNQCPTSCGGDPNAMPGCGINCGKQCQNNLNPKLCPRIKCKPDKCDCKDGFFFDPNINKCVKREQCSLACNQLNNEVYDPCVNGGCGWKNCSQVGGPVLCIDVLKCFQGCSCKEGYYRIKDGTCVPRDKCPSSCGGDPNAEPGCGLNCNKHCSNINGKKGICPRIACPPNGCECKPGFYFNPNTKMCVAPKDCFTDNSTGIDRLNQGNDAFTGEFLYQLYKLNPGKSFVASPFSVLIPLAQLALFAKGTTFDQLIKVLNLRSKDEIRNTFPALIKTYRDQEQVKLILAAKSYADQKFPFSTSFIQQSKEVFDAETQNINFSNSTQAAKIINDWVKQKTNGLISTLVGPQLFDSSTRFVITNAIYFLGNWTKQFNPNNTRDKDFFVANNKSVQLKTMFQEETFRYAFNKKLNAQVLQLFYKGGNLSLVIVLPKDIEGINETINTLRDTPIRDVVNMTSFVKVRVSLPMYDITSVMNLFDIFKKVNVTLDQPTDDLNEILQKPEKLRVSAAVQKCRIKVDPTGTEAAAANAIIARTTSVAFPPPKVIDFVADHPFAFYIVLGENPIFCGTYTGPQD